MTANTRVRGALIGFSSTFTDEAGASYTPETATLKVCYKVNGVETIDTVTMNFTGATAKASWDSSVADANYVYWFVTAGTSSKPADQGSFILVANKANP